MTEHNAAPPMLSAVVIGASGGIGAALVEALAASGRHSTVHALSRSGSTAATANVRPGVIDIGDPASIAAAAAAIGAPVDLVIVATGLLHEGDRRPERSLRELDAAWLARLFAINTIGPALAIQAFAPLLPRDRPSTIACLSARVGSIADNRLGGWYGYRASKAALNQIVRTAAIELARTRPQALCVALHPGTVATPLSAPFRGNIAGDTLLTPEFSAERLLAVLDTLQPADTGGIFAWDGQSITP